MPNYEKQYIEYANRIEDLYDTLRHMAQKSSPKSLRKPLLVEVLQITLKQSGLISHAKCNVKGEVTSMGLAVLSDYNNKSSYLYSLRTGDYAIWQEMIAPLKQSESISRDRMVDFDIKSGGYPPPQMTKEYRMFEDRQHIVFSSEEIHALSAIANNDNEANNLTDIVLDDVLCQRPINDDNRECYFPAFRKIALHAAQRGVLVNDYVEMNSLVCQAEKMRDVARLPQKTRAGWEKLSATYDGLDGSDYNELSKDIIRNNRSLVSQHQQTDKDCERE